MRAPGPRRPTSRRMRIPAARAGWGVSPPPPAVEVGEREPPPPLDDRLRPGSGLPAEHAAAQEIAHALARGIHHPVAVEIALEGDPGGLGEDHGGQSGAGRGIAGLAQLLGPALESDPRRLLA